MTQLDYPLSSDFAPNISDLELFKHLILEPFEALSKSSQFTAVVSITAIMVTFVVYVLPRYERSHRTVVLAGHLNNLMEIRDKCDGLESAASRHGLLKLSSTKRLLDVEIRETEAGLIENLSNARPPIFSDAIVGDPGSIIGASKDLNWDVFEKNPKIIVSLLWVYIKLLIFTYPFAYVIRTWVLNTYDFPLNKLQYAAGERYFMNVVDLSAISIVMLSSLVIIMFQTYRHEKKAFNAPKV